MEKTPVDLTVEQVADALTWSVWAVLKQIREDKGRKQRGEPLVFPGAYLLHNSRKYGFRIPEGDVLAYAERQGAGLVAQAQVIIEDARVEQRKALTRLLESRRQQDAKPALVPA